MVSWSELDWPVRTERLVLRPMADTDIDAVWDYRRLPAVHDHLGWLPTSRDDFAAGLVARREGGAQFALVVLLDDRVIGDIVVMRRNAWAQSPLADSPEVVGSEAELGWVLHPAYGGQGHATEAVRAVVDLCFGPVGLRRVQAGCFADNTASWRLMERIGMRREEYSRKSGLHRTGVWLDGMMYGLLAEEWAGLRPQ